MLSKQTGPVEACRDSDIRAKNENHWSEPSTWKFRKQRQDRAWKKDQRGLQFSTIKGSWAWKYNNWLEPTNH